MDSNDAERHILDTALGAITDGIDDFLDLFDHCMATTDLAAVAAEAGIHPDIYLFELLETSDRVHLGEDDRLVRLDVLSDDLVFTHRLTARELDRGSVDILPDLPAVDLGCDELQVPGGAVTFQFDLADFARFDDQGSFVGPPGWLDGFTAGDLVAFRRRGSNLVLEKIDIVGEGIAEAAALATAYTELTEVTQAGREPVELVEWAILDDPTLFRSPVRPLGELLAAAGLEVVGAYAGPAGEPWQSPPEALMDEIREDLRDTYHLESCCETALDEVTEAFTAFGLDEPVDVKSVNGALHHGPVAEAFLDWIDSFGTIASDPVGGFARMLATSGRADTAPALFVLARHLEARGEVLAAEEQLETAVRLDPRFGPAAAELAWYASDRGDAARTVSLLRGAGIGEDDPMLAFHAKLGGVTADVGRNDPCPCGSGRKYKVCHLGRPLLEPVDRMNWLLSKLTMFATRPRQLPALYDIADLAATGFPGQLGDRVSDPFVMELRLFEGGGVAEFLAERGVLLPDDERDLLELWTLARLALWEVVDSDGERRLTVRDTRSGDTIDVTEHSLARDFQPGDQLLARFVPAWDRTMATGVTLRLGTGRRESLMELLDTNPGVEDLAYWYASLFAPPVLQNRDGEELVACNARLRPVGSWEELGAVLDETYERDDPGTWRDVIDEGADRGIIRAVLTREGDELVVVTNSVERLDRVLDRLAEVTEVIDRTVDESSAAQALANVGEALPELPVPDEEILAQIQEELEARWLDEPVPALGGLTPREAAEDPTRREDLIGLLRSYDHIEMPEGALRLRPDVLRRHLGITE